MNAIEANNLAKTYRTKCDYDPKFYIALEKTILKQINDVASMGDFKMFSNYYYLANNSNYKYPTTNAVERTNYCELLQNALLTLGYLCTITKDHNLEISW